jgi:hypothetical protein
MDRRRGTGEVQFPISGIAVFAVWYSLLPKPGLLRLVMDAFSCAECRAIYLELREALSIFQGTPEVDIDPARLGEWVRGLDEEECTRIRETSNLWKAWRRLQEHRTVTGHVLSVLPLPPNAISNPN